MSFLSRVGKVTSRFGRTVNNVGAAVKTIANSGVVRGISTAIGSVGRAAMPLITAAAPELAPAVGMVSRGLQNGSILNTVAKVGGTASQIGNIISKVKV
jgi:hypothetical protein